MAEGLARAFADQRGREVEVRSAGTMGIVDHPADAKAVAVCGEIDVDISSHKSKGVSSEDIAWADYVLVMEYAHAAFLRERFPEIGERLILLGSFAGMLDIPDPLGGWKFQFRRSREQIRKAVESFVDRLPPRKVESTA
jgi:protein-tyrosine-phosphatase